MRWPLRLVVFLALVGLTAFYSVGATSHARRVNTERGRADQSGYLWDAVAIHGARHGGEDVLIGERNRMPVYPWLLSWLYDPTTTQDQFFEVAKTWNIRLSLVLLGVLWAVVRWHVPTLPAASLVLVVAFGYFVFKAGYAQVELLYYTAFFLTFASAWRLLESTQLGATIGFALLTGVLAAFTHLTKAAVLPLLACVAVPFTARAIVQVVAQWRADDRSWVRTLARHTAAGGVCLVCFLALLSPYLLNSKRVFGHYFYNVNTTFYVWYDNWNLAANGTYRRGDGVGWPKMDPKDIPTMGTYLRTRPPGVIAARIGNGLREMVTVSYGRLWYFKYVVLYLLFGVTVVATAWPTVRGVVVRHAATAGFLGLYGGVYTLATAFYQPISGTTLRMLLAHVAPLLFIITALVWRTPLCERSWRVAGLTLRPAHFHVLMVALVCFDVVFRIWPWLMIDFAGY